MKENKNWIWVVLGCVGIVLVIMYVIGLVSSKKKGNPDSLQAARDAKAIKRMENSLLDESIKQGQEELNATNEEIKKLKEQEPNAQQ